LTIVNPRATPPIKQQLLNDGLVTPALLETCTAMLDANKFIPARYSRIIHSFGQLFHVNFDMTILPLFTVTMNQLHFLRLYITYKKPPYSSELC
jgi:hypothetical protein